MVDLIAMKAYKFDGDKAVEIDIPADMADAVEEAREMLIDAAASADDDLTEKYLEEMTLSEEDIIAGLKKGTLEGTVIPCSSPTRRQRGRRHVPAALDRQPDAQHASRAPAAR